MKKLLLSLGLLTSTLSFSQITDCSQLFISEYVEGWGTNKALEIYNPTAADINLSGYFVTRYSNGSTTATVANSVQLSGIVPAHDVFVAVADKRDPNGTGQEAPIWDSLEVRADGFFSPDYLVSNTFYWNGNDAILLAKGTLPSDPTTVINPANVTGFQFVDIFGKIGENPVDATGSTTAGAWTNQFPYSTGLGVLITQDHSMIRKSTVLKGVTANPSFFNPMSEYDTIPAVVVRLDANGDTLFGTSGNPILDGNWFSLGTHNCTCNPASVDELNSNSLMVYPNPSNGIVNVRNNGNLKSIQLVNSLGQTINTVANITNKQLITLDLNDLRGVYFLKITSQNGEQQLRKVILK